jgi:hypothetical protein
VAAGTEICEFLTTRRARITPAQAGLRAYGTRRRVNGLRREEVAILAGISVEYYTQLERGSVSGVSDDVVEAAPARSSSTRSNGRTRARWTDEVRARSPSVR